MLVLYVLITLIFGFVCWIAGAASIMQRNDGQIIVKKFNEDGASLCNVRITITPEEFRKRATITLRCKEVGK